MTGRTVPQAQTYGGFHFGRVLNTHGVGIDAPLSLVRTNYSDSLMASQLVVLHNDWRGQYDIGSYAGGTLNKPCRRVTRSSNFQTYSSDGSISDYPKFGGPTNTSWFHCLEVEWPAPHVWVTRETRNRSLMGPIGWMGTQIDGMRDLSGQMYMRNRYYDPATGRFTQEDPIGLAGGLNVYGFAGGDPVSSDDPYGLCCTYSQDTGTRLTLPTRAQVKADWGTFGRFLGRMLFGGWGDGSDAMVSPGMADPVAIVSGAAASRIVGVSEAAASGMAGDNVAIAFRAGQRMTRWGWSGGQKYRAAVTAVRDAADNSTLGAAEMGGILPTRQEAERLIAESGGRVLRVERPHAGLGHKVPHINYSTANGREATVEVQSVGRQFRH